MVVKKIKKWMNAIEMTLVHQTFSTSSVEAILLSLVTHTNKNQILNTYVKSHFGWPVLDRPHFFLDGLLFVVDDDLVDLGELQLPLGVVEELSQVEAVVVRAVGLGMVGGREHGHLVAVHRVEVEETLDFLGHQTWLQVRPLVEKPLEHGERTTAADLSQFAELVQLVIAHAHLHFVQLLRLRVTLNEGSQLCSGFSPCDLGKHRYIQFIRHVYESSIQVGFVNTTDWVDIG